MLELPPPVPADRLTLPSDEVLAARRAWREERQRRRISVSDSDIDWLVAERSGNQRSAGQSATTELTDSRAEARRDVEAALEMTPRQVAEALQSGELDLAVLQVAADANAELQQGKDAWVGHVQYIPEPDAELIERATQR